MMTAASPNLVSLLQHRVYDHPAEVAYVFLSGTVLRESHLTYRELHLQAKVIASFLQELSAQDERALLLYPPGLEFITAFFGCLYAGVIPVPAYPPRLNRNALRLASIARDSGATLALSTNEVCCRLPAIAEHAQELANLRWIATDNLNPGSTNIDHVVLPRNDGLAYLQYTSGSTANPKGVMITHENVLDNSAYLAKAFRHSEEDISLSWLPHFHDLGLVHGIIQPLYSRFTGYLMAPMSFLQRPLDWLKAISQFRVTHSDGPNFAYELCVNKLTEEHKHCLDLSSWRMALNGAEPVFPQTIERFTAAFARCGFKKNAFYPAYGLAEATLAVSGGKNQDELVTRAVRSSALERNRVVIANDADRDRRILVGSGAYAPPMEVEIVDPESGRKCAPDEIGEIWVSGPSVALGYWNRPEESEKLFRAKMQGGTRDFLRTGDLGFVHDGNVFITGRLKELIINRGRNYYPQDIERTAREACPETLLAGGAAFSVSIGTQEQVVLVQEVQRHKRIDVHEVFCRIREAVAEEHEIQLMEIVLVKPGSVPKTSSGKLQRGLCCKEFLEGKLQVIARWQANIVEDEFQEQRDSAPLEDVDAIEHWLRSQVAFRLRLNAADVNVDRPLLNLGLDSLAAVELAHDVQKKLGMVWQAAVFLEDVTIRDLAARAAQALKGAAVLEKIPLRSSAAEEYPLSCGQQGLWFLHQLSPDSAAYNIVQAIRITSEIDLPALRRSFQVLVERHPSLHTTFTAGNGSPVQRVRQNSEFFFHSEDAGKWSESQLNERLTLEAHKPFNLESEYLFRVYVFSRLPGEHVLLLVAHHIILDLWSLAQLLAEFSVVYPAERSGTEIKLSPSPCDYSQFVFWQKEMLAGEKGRQLWSYWSGQLAGELPLLELPYDSARPDTQTFRGSLYAFELNDDLTSSLKKLSRQCGVTPYVTLLAAFQVLLYRYTRERDILVGSPAAGRTRGEFASSVGYFVNPVVLRSNVPPDSSFRVFLSERVRKIVLDGLEHQDYPFTLLTERLQPIRDPQRSPIFQVMFAMQKAHLLHEEGLSLFALGDRTVRANLGGLEMQPVALEQRVSQFDLSLIIAEAHHGFAATFEYNTDLFEAGTISRMARHFLTLLESLADDPGQEISQLRLLAHSEATQVIRFTLPVSPASQAIPVHQLFEEQVARTPNATAIVFEGEQLSYRKLNERSNRFARYLSHAGVRPGTRVAVCLERSVEMIVSLLGVFKAGAVYVPLDPEYPGEHRDFQLRDCGAEVLIARACLSQSRFAGTPKVVCLDAEEKLIEHESGGNPELPSNTDAVAYIIYTSGSTGAPKGVLISHRALASHMQWLASEFPLNERDRVLHKYSPSFDASLSEIFHALITGAALVIGRAGGQYDMRYLTELIREHRVTEIDLVPTMLRAFLQEEGITACRSLRRIISGGETLTTDLQQRVYQQLGPVELVNMYGPTETAITAMFHRCSPEENRPRIPIGIPVADTQVYVLDESLQPTPIGVPGEIYIGGGNLAYGYLKQPSLTAKKFIPDPFSSSAGARLYRTGDLGRYGEAGVVEYIGRADTQVKIHGFRIELAEVEQQLRKHSGVSDVAMVVRTRWAGEKYIAAYVEPTRGNSITSAQLRARLNETLPRHMVPAAIMVVERLPRLHSGKVELRALPEPAGAVPEKEYRLPRNHKEAALARIWEQVLDRKRVGIYDNFFELGGDSILSIQVVARAREIGLELTPRQMFQFQTIADLASTVGKGQGELEIPVAPDGPFTLTPIQKWFFEQDLKTANHYIQSLLLEVDQPLDVSLLREAMQHLILHHDALRLRFDRTEAAGWQQRVVSANSVTALEHIPLPGLPREEQPKQVREMATKLGTNLDLAEGPIIRAAYFDFGPDNPHQLFIFIHHLSVDAVSWRILLDHLQRVYGQLKAGEQPAFADPPLSFRQWAELLYRHAQSREVCQELAWWIGELSAPIAGLPLDHQGDNTAESAATLCVSVSPDETKRVLQDLPRAYRTEINDVLLAALLQTLTRWTNQQSMVIDLEGHGREEIIDGVEPSAIVGWHTSMYPVRLEAKPEFSPSERLKWVKEHLRKIPYKGVGFGLLRYLCADEAITGQLKALAGRQVSFNYLGRLDQICSPGTPFRVIRLEGPLKTSFGKRSHILEIDAYIKDSTLHLAWTYSTALHNRNTIQVLALDFIQELRALIQDCSLRKTGEYTSSDFPLVQLSGPQLTRIREIHGAITDMYPLSPMQQGMLFHSLYEPQKGTYLTQLVCEISGDLDRERFQRAWQVVIDHHATLRSEFEWEIVTEEPVQLIKRAVKAQWHFGNWTDDSRQQQSTLLDAYLKDDRAQPMDPQCAPLMRFALFTAGSSRHVFIWSSHHLLTDGWSLPLLLKNVFAGYEALSRKARVDLRPERPYRDYIAWLKQQDPTAAEKFWRDSLRGVTAPTTLEPLRPAIHPTPCGEEFCEYEIRLSESETAELCEFARRHHFTLSTVAYGMWAVLLSRITGKSDLLFGAVVSGRQFPLARATEMVGIFINTLPVRVKIEPACPLVEWLAEIQDRQSEAGRFGHSSLSSIQSWCELPRGTSLFDHVLVFENYSTELWNTISSNLRILNIRSYERSNYPLTVWIMPGKQLCVKAGYDPFYLESSKVTAALESYRALLCAAGNLRDEQTSESIRGCLTLAAPGGASAVADGGTPVQPPPATTGSELEFSTPLAGVDRRTGVQRGREGEKQEL